MLIYRRTIVGHITGPTFHLRNHQPPCYDQPQNILTLLPLTPITDLLTFSLERTMWRSWGYQTVPMMGRFEIVQPHRLEYNICCFFLFIFSWSTNLCVTNLVTLPAPSKFSDIAFLDILLCNLSCLVQLKQEETREGGRVRQLSDDPKRAIFR